MSAAIDVKKSILYSFETTVWQTRISYCSEHVKKKFSGRPLVQIIIKSQGK